IGGLSGGVQRVTGMQVTPSFFRVLRETPYRGQLFSEEDAEFGRPRRVVLSHGLWQQLSGGRDDMIGSDLRINGVPHVVAGVLSPAFLFSDPDVQLWTAAAFS